MTGPSRATYLYFEILFVDPLDPVIRRGDNSGRFLASVQTCRVVSIFVIFRAKYLRFLESLYILGTSYHLSTGAGMLKPIVFKSLTLVKFSSLIAKLALACTTISTLATLI